MRSVVVVFPASICAMMPMFLQRDSGTCRGTLNLNSFPTSKAVLDCRIAELPNCGIVFQFGNSAVTRFGNLLSPAVMRERLVRFRHAVHVFLLLDGRAAVVGRVQQ